MIGGRWIRLRSDIVELEQTGNQVRLSTLAVQASVRTTLAEILNSELAQREASVISLLANDAKWITKTGNGKI